MSKANRIKHADTPPVVAPAKQDAVSKANRIEYVDKPPPAQGSDRESRVLTALADSAR